MRHAPLAPVARSPIAAVPETMLRAVGFILAAVLVVSGAGVPSLAASDVEAEVGGGFKSNHIFLNGPGGDSIDPFSGAAETVINIGPTLKAGGGLELGLTLHHSSKIWKRETLDGVGNPKLRRGPFGVGWKMHMGRVFSMSEGPNTIWTYESPDGARHTLGYWGSSPLMTNDGTFIRAEALDANGNIIGYPGTDPDSWRLYMGNGVVHILDWSLTEANDGNHGNDEELKGLYTTQIERWDSPGHAVGRIVIKYEEGAALAHCINKIEFRDTSAAEPGVLLREVTFANLATIEGGVTTGITFPAVYLQGPAFATYQFTYQLANLVFNPPIPPNPPDPNVPSFPNQALLTRVDFPAPVPNSTENIYSMSFGYDLDASDNVTGELIWRKLPTGATIAYEYASYIYELNFGPTSGVYLYRLREVKKKHVLLNPAYNPNLPIITDPNQSSNPNYADGTWTYTRNRVGQEHPKQVRVKDPFGNETMYDFDPNITVPPSAGLVKAVRIYDGSAGDFGTSSGSGPLIRTERKEYSHVMIGAGQVGTLPSAEWTILNDDIGQIFGWRSSELESYGHFKVTKEYDFATPNAQGLMPIDAPVRRVTRRTYAADPAPNTDRYKFWFIHKLEQQVVEDNLGTLLRKSTWSYVDDGRVTQQVQFADPTSSNPGDNENIRTQYFYDSATTNLVRSHIGKMMVGAPAFGSRLEYLNNVHLRKSWTVKDDDPNGLSSQGAFSYPSKELVRDPNLPNSGAVIATIDPAGFRTDLYFDRLGRVTKISPAHDPNEWATVIDYRNISETWVTRGNAGSADYIQTKHLYDTLGRLIEIRRRSETGCEARQATTYDIAGREEFVSEWRFLPGSGCPSEQVFDPNAPIGPGNELKGTSFEYWSGSPTARDYDPLGRLLKVKTADDNITAASYVGNNSTVTITNLDGTPSTTYYERDAFGNLVFVDAPEGADGRYTYGPVGELLRVELLSGTMVQPRILSYDKLGRLMSSTNPENGTIQFTQYDAAGRVREKLDSDGTKFAFSYDSAGRLRTSTAAEDITDPSAAPGTLRVYGASRNLAQNFYDQTSVDNGAGRLTSAISYDEKGLVLSRRTFSYGARNGRLSEEATTFAGWDGRLHADPSLALDPNVGFDSTRDYTFKTCYAYDTFGQLSEMRYPSTTACGSAPPGVAQLVYGYKNGALDSIRDANRDADPNNEMIRSVTYNASGGMRKVVYGNGRATAVVPDVMSRPQLISVLLDPNTPDDPNNHNDTLFRTGQYTFDGAGNILSVGPATADANSIDIFKYDKLSRLTESWTRYLDSAQVLKTYKLTYDYDGFGNLVDNEPSFNRPIRKYHGTTLPLSELGTPVMETNQLSNRLLRLNGQTSAHDQRGNLLGDSSQEHLFDERNRLLATKNSTPAVPVGQYAYDAGGMRILKSKPATEARTFYVRDGGGNVLSEFTLPPAKWDEYHQKDYFYALGRVIGMAEEKSPGPVQGLWGGMYYDPPDMSVTLNWVLNTDPNISGYRVYRKKDAGSWLQRGSTLSPTTTTFTDDSSPLPPGGLEDGHTYRYRVAAVNSLGLEGIPSRTLMFVMAESSGLATPTELTLEKLDQAVSLRWQRVAQDSGYASSGSDPNTTFQGYNVYRKDPGGVVWNRMNLIFLTEPVFHDLGAAPNQTQGDYSYQVTAVGTTWGNESAGALVGGQPGDDDPPAPPTGLRALSGPLAGEITLVWDRAPEADVQGYRIYEKVGSSYTVIVDPNNDPNSAVQEYKWAFAQAGTNHTFAVSARDNTSLSGLSALATTRTRLSASVLSQPSQGVGTRFLTWPDTLARLDLTFSNTSGSERRIYRKRDDEPWHAYERIYSSSSASLYTDSTFDRCRAYTYKALAYDPNGESVDPDDSIFSERLLRPATPQVTTMASNPSYANLATVTLTWGGIIGCDAARDGYEIEGWIVRTVLDPNNNWTLPSGTACIVNVPSQNVVIENPAVTSCTFTYPTNDNIGRSYAVVAKVRNLYHYNVDPNDEVAKFKSFISEDVCAAGLAGVITTEPCGNDLAQNDPPIGGGGGGIPDPELEPGRLLRRNPSHHTRLPGPAIDAPVIASTPTSNPDPLLAESNESFSPDFLPSQIPRLTSVGDLRPPFVGQSPQDVDLPGTTLEPRPDLVAPHRVIGAPSSKQFSMTFFHHDHLGSIRLVTNAAGAKVGESKYLPFGEEILGTGWAGNTHGYTGHERDAETGLDYMLARHYHPSIGRFIAADPVLHRNLYAYTRGNPIKYVDPLGMFDAMADGESSRDQMRTQINAWRGGGTGGIRSVYERMWDKSRNTPYKSSADLTDNPIGIPNSPDPSAVARHDPGPQPDPGCVPPYCEHIWTTPDPIPHTPPCEDVDSNVERVLLERMTIRGWVNRVRNKGPWDYKQRGIFGEYVFFGNFNYGATGRAVGLPRWVIRAGAGYAAWRAGTSGQGPWNDDATDQYWIEAGMDYYDNKYGN